MTFRWAEGEELEVLRPVVAARGWTPLDPVFAKALIAEDDQGEVVGFNALQVVLRPEPIWVRPQCRGQEQGDIAMQLATRMAEYLKAAGATYWETKAESPYAVRLCEANGMKPLTMPVYAFGERE